MRAPQQTSFKPENPECMAALGDVLAVVHEYEETKL
jgi:hypothetical protein